MNRACRGRYGSHWKNRTEIRLILALIVMREPAAACTQEIAIAENPLAPPWCTSAGSIARVKTSASLESDQESETARGTRLVVAVDGPSGAGKSSASRGAASALGLRYLDTGAMYRALTWWLLDRGVDTTDSEVVAGLAAEPVIEVSTDPRAPWTRVDGTDVSEAIRTREVTGAVSAVAAVPQVRAHLIAMQREIIAHAPRESWPRAATSARWSRPTRRSRCT